MKKRWMMMFLVALTMVVMTACDEVQGEEGSEKIQLAMIDYDQIKEINRINFSEYGYIVLTLADERQITTNTLVAHYKFDENMREQVMTFLTNQRTGTLTPNYPAKEGKIAIIGWDKREYHFVEKVSYGSSIDVKLVNGVMIKTNDTVSVYEYTNKEEKEEILKQVSDAQSN